MLGVDEFRQAWNIITHPGSISKTMEVGEALSFYYKASIIPLVIGVVLAAVFGAATGGMVSLLVGHGLLGLATSAVVAAISIVIVLLYVLALIPVSILLNAAIYQLFAKRLFGIWGKPFKFTTTAVLYGVLPQLLFIWLTFIPAVGAFISIALSIWSIIVLIISMARQQGISGLRAFGGILLSGVALALIIIVIVFVAALVGLGVFSSGLAGSSAQISGSCVASSGYYCTLPAYSNGSITLTVGQSTGSNWASAEFMFVPTGYNVTQVPYASLPGGLTSGAFSSISIPIIKSAIPPAKGGIISGEIYASYKLTTGQAVPTMVPIATAFFPVK